MRKTCTGVLIRNITIIAFSHCPIRYRVHLKVFWVRLDSTLDRQPTALPSELPTSRKDNKYCHHMGFQGGTLATSTVRVLHFLNGYRSSKSLPDSTVQKSEIRNFICLKHGQYKGIITEVLSFTCFVSKDMQIYKLILNYYYQTIINLIATGNFISLQHNRVKTFLQQPL